MQETALAILSNSLWQAALLLAAGWLGSRALMRAAASSRYVLWSIVLLLACVLPVVALANFYSSEHEASRSGSTASVHRIWSPQAGPMDAPIVDGSKISAAAAEAEEATFSSASIATPRQVSRVILASYAGIAALLLLAMLLDVVRMMKLKRRAHRMSADKEQILVRCGRICGVRRSVSYGTSDDIETPVFVGLLRPMLLMPRRTIAQVDASELQQVGAHELAHAHRRDDWRALAERCARSIFFFNPAVHWICGRLALEREMACDEWVVARADTTADAYAATLLRVAERAVWTSRAQYASALTGSCLRRRIEWLLDADFPSRTRVSARHAAVAAVAVVLAGIAIIVGPSVAFSIESVDAVQSAATRSDSPAVDAAIDELARAGYSGAVLIALDGRIITHRGFGERDRRTHEPVAATSHFNSGALAKMLTAAAILRLEREGKLSVRDPVTRWVGELPSPKNAVTIHDLLIHAGGLTPQNAPVFEADRTRFIERIRTAPADFVPGSALRHTDVGYSVLAVIVELASGMSYEQYVRAHLLEPAGMTQTWFQNETSRGDVAAEYSRTGDPRSAVGTRSYTWGRRGAMGIYSTVEDLYRWQLALDNGMFSIAEIDRMHTAGVHNPWGSTTGYGWETRTSTRGTTVHHLLSGWPGNSIELMSDPAAHMTIALIIDNRVDWRNPRYDDLARMTLRSATPAELQHLLTPVREPR